MGGFHFKKRGRGTKRRFTLPFVFRAEFPIVAAPFVKRFTTKETAITLLGVCLVKTNLAHAGRALVVWSTITFGAI